MTEQDARQLLADECRKRNVAFLVDRETGELDTLGQAAVAAVLAALTPHAQAREFAPCPLCKQYSHSIGEDQLSQALMHFQSMYAHPLRGHPMGHNFDEQTRDAAQVLVAAVLAAGRAEREAAVKIATDLAEIIGAKPKFDQPTYTSVDAWKMVEDACRDIADGIRGDHAPPVGEMGGG